MEGKKLIKRNEMKDINTSRFIRQLHVRSDPISDFVVMAGLAQGNAKRIETSCRLGHE